MNGNSSQISQGFWGTNESLLCIKSFLFSVCYVFVISCKRQFIYSYLCFNINRYISKITLEQNNLKSLNNENQLSQTSHEAVGCRGRSDTGPTGSASAARSHAKGASLQLASSAGTVQASCASQSGQDRDTLNLLVRSTAQRVTSKNKLIIRKKV